MLPRFVSAYMAILGGSKSKFIQFKWVYCTENVQCEGGVINTRLSKDLHEGLHFSIITRLANFLGPGFIQLHQSLIRARCDPPRLMLDGAVYVRSY